MRSPRPRLTAAASRLLAIVAAVGLVGSLPWLSGRSAEYTILRARSAEQAATPESLGSVREQLDLDRSVLEIWLDWAGGLLRGDAGTSWVSGRPVLPTTLDALGVSLTLMSFALVVTMLVAGLITMPALGRGVRRRPARGSGVVGASLTALPEFLLASVLLVLGAVVTGWFPPFGWGGPQHAVLPALAMGLPAGGLLGRLVSVAVTDASHEAWIDTWRTAGARPLILGRALLRRALPSVLPQAGLVIIGLIGGAVAVEEVFAIPGLGRATLAAASSQDVPSLQAGLLLLLLIAAVIGVAVEIGRRLMVGPALFHGSLPAPVPVAVAHRFQTAVPVVCLAALGLVITAGLPRDPNSSSSDRLAAPSLSLPFGADASGRDLLARVAHGSVTTLGLALLVVAVCLVLGLVIGVFARASVGPVEVANAVPPILAGLVVAAVVGPGAAGAVIAVSAVGWAPLAAHTAALVSESQSHPHVQMLPTLGVGRSRVLLQHVLPSVVAPVVRHAALRIPGIALALAALGFLGLGARPPQPEWGLVLAEGMAYVERAPWTVLAPTVMLTLVSVLAVSLSSWAGHVRPTMSPSAGSQPSGPAVPAVR